MKIDGAWGGGRDSAYKDAPQHRRPGSRVPDGGNSVCIDGSAAYTKFEKMFYLHSWNTGGSRLMYFYQNPSDFEDRMLRVLGTTLKARP
jgi:hypothetical protein